jgi:hypothetical protein
MPYRKRSQGRPRPQKNVLGAAMSALKGCRVRPMRQRKRLRRQRSAQHDAVAAELGGDLQAAAERFSVAGRRADVRGARVGVLDGAHLVGKELLSHGPVLS